MKSGTEIVIPDKLFFRIGEVAKLCSLPAYVLRFWETEFPQLKPGKSNTGQRLYRRKDVENVVRVKKLLYEEGYTINGARQFLKTEAKRDRSQTALPFAQASATNPADLLPIKKGLQEVLAILAARR
jgi:DNA-binding transcriptional MerR regulator